MAYVGTFALQVHGYPESLGWCFLDIQVWGFWFLLVLLCGSWRPPWPTILRKPPAPWINLSQNPLRVLDCRAGWHKRSHISSSLFLGAEIWTHFWRVVEWYWMFKVFEFNDVQCSNMKPFRPQTSKLGSELQRKWKLSSCMSGTHMKSLFF